MSTIRHLLQGLEVSSSSWFTLDSYPRYWLWRPNRVRLSVSRTDRALLIRNNFSASGTHFCQRPGNPRGLRWTWSRKCVVSARWCNSPYISSFARNSQRNVSWACCLLAWRHRVVAAFTGFDPVRFSSLGLPQSPGIPTSSPGPRKFLPFRTKLPAGSWKSAGRGSISASTMKAATWVR
jgi:hypothetical protein